MILQSIQRYSGCFDVRFSDVSEHELQMIVNLLVDTIEEKNRKAALDEMTEIGQKMVDYDVPEIDGRKDSDGWIPWNGGDCPIPKRSAGSFMVRFRDGTEDSPTKHPALAYRWWHCTDEDKYVLSQNDIIAYRLMTKP